MGSIPAILVYLYFNTKFKKTKLHILAIQTRPIFYYKPRNLNQFLNYSSKLNYISKNTKNLSNNVNISKHSISKTKLVLENNWVHASNETRLSTRHYNRYNLNYIFKKKSLQKMNIYNLNKLSYNSKFLRNSLNSINSLKKLLLVGNGNTFSYKITPKHKRTFHNYKTNTLIDNKFKKFYSNSLSYMRPTYLRSFSKVNKRKVFITFKNNNTLDNTFNLRYQNTDNSYLLYVIFSLQSFPSVHTISSYSSSSSFYLSRKIPQFDQGEMSSCIPSNPTYTISTTVFNVNYFSKFIFSSFNNSYTPNGGSLILKDLSHKLLKYDTYDESLI